MVNVSDDVRAKAQGMAAAILSLYQEEGLSPFPYEDCRVLLDGLGDEYEGFIPDLDMWCSSIAGYSSWGKRIVRWSEQQLIEARGLMSTGFFDEHPEYATLERHIRPESAPDLHDELRLYEGLRIKLLELFDYLLRERRRGL
jgi:hypothetical protein